MRYLILLKNFASVLLVTMFLLVFTVKANAQQNSVLDVPKGKFVVLKIPGKLVGFERVSTWTGAVSHGAVIEQSEKSGLMIGGLSDWRTAGWTLMRQLTLEKVSRKDRFTEVELRDPLFNVKLRFDSSIKDVNVAFREVAFVGLLSEFEASEYYQKEVVEKMLPKIFTGGLASIPTKSKLKLLEELKYVDSAIKTEKYKGDTYLSVDVGGDVEVYNTIRLNQSQRLAHTLNQRVLSYLKRIARTIKFNSEVDGIKITILVPYKNFITETYLEPNYDRLEIYVPMDVIRQFADDELTNEEFVEEAILLVNGNRARLSELKSL